MATSISGLQSLAVSDFGLTIAASGTATISQDTLDNLIEKSIINLNGKLDLGLAISGDLITPEPTDSIKNLLLLNLECLMSKYLNEASKSSPEIKSVKLGDISLEFSDISEKRSKDIESKMGYCKGLEDAIMLYSIETTSGLGDIIWDGNTRRYEDVDHDGTTENHRHFNPLSDNGKNNNNQDYYGSDGRCQ